LATVVQPMSPAPLSVSAVDAVLSGSAESGISTTVTATMTRSNDAFDRHDFDVVGPGGPSSSLLAANSANRSIIAPIASPIATPITTQPIWSVTVSLTFGPVLPKGWNSSLQHVGEHLATITSVVFQFVPSMAAGDVNHGRPPAPVRAIGRISPPDFALMVAAAVRAQTAWAAAYLSEANSGTEPANLGDASDAAKRSGGIQRATDDGEASAARTTSTRSHDGAEEGGYVEFALLSSSDSKAAGGKNEEDSLDVLPEGDSLLPWEVDEEVIDDLLAAGVAGEETDGESTADASDDAARMAFSADEGGLVSLDGTVFAEIDPAQYVDATDDAQNVATAEPVEVRMDTVLRLFQAFEVTTEVLEFDVDSSRELISVPVESLPAEAVPVETVAPKPQESGPQNGSHAAAALVVGLVSVGATIGRRSR
jgi:hypothetical protein